MSNCNDRAQDSILHGVAEHTELKCGSGGSAMGTQGCHSSGIISTGPPSTGWMVVALGSAMRWSELTRAETRTPSAVFKSRLSSRVWRVGTLRRALSRASSLLALWRTPFGGCLWTVSFAQWRHFSSALGGSARRPGGPDDMSTHAAVRTWQVGTGWAGPRMPSTLSRRTGLWTCFALAADRDDVGADWTLVQRLGLTCSG